MSNPPSVNITSNLPGRKLTLAAININSVTSPGRIEELQGFVDDNKIDILAMSELKIDSSVHPSLFSLANFHPPIVKPRTRRGGGTGIYVSKSLPFNRMVNLENDDTEAVWAKVKIGDKLLIICSTYLPPHTPVDKQLRYLDQLTDSVTQAQAHSPELIIIMGDFNGGNCWLPPDAPRHSPINAFDNKLLSTAESLGMTQLISTATRIQDGIHNIRDLIFTSSTDVVRDSGILSSFSNLDHFPVYVALSIDRPTMGSKRSMRILDYRNADIPSLIHILSQTDWDAITNKDVDGAAEALTDALQDAAHRCIPAKNVRIRKDKLWVTADLRRQIRKRDRLFKLARSRQREHDWARWRAQRNLVTSINRKLRNQHIQLKVGMLLECKKEPFKYHTMLKNITGFRRESSIPPLLAETGTIISDDSTKAEEFNSFF